MAQLTWWIIFQVGRGNELTGYRHQTLRQDSETIAYMVNHDFQRLTHLASQVLSGPAPPQQLQELLDSLIVHPAVLGCRIADPQHDGFLGGGEEDSTFYAAIGPGSILYFVPEYPGRIAETITDDLFFQVHGSFGGAENEWVQPEMFRAAPGVLEQWDHEARRRVVMFVFEGGFFVLILLFGAYLIFRTLQKTEDLKLRQANFTQTVTHEFRTPLTSLQLYLETLQSGRVEAAKANELYAKMLNDCDRLDSMVDNILEAGRFGREKYELKLSETDLSRDLEEYLNGLSPVVERGQGVLLRNIEKNIRVRTDYQALGRAVRALVDNALKYSPPERREIKVSLRRGKRHAELTVTDRGVGLEAAELTKVFDRFYRVGERRTRRTRGTGLGLYLVDQIVRAHGGSTIAASAGPDQGAAFTIKILLVKK